MCIRDSLWGALRGIVRGRVFDENFLMSVATVGAVALGDMGEACLLYTSQRRLKKAVRKGRVRREERPGQLLKARVRVLGAVAAERGGRRERCV